MSNQTDPNAKKIALITGASRGLGRATAIALAERGVGVIGTYLSNKQEADRTAAEIAVKGGKAVMLQLDTGKVAGFDAFATQVRAALKQKWSRESFDYLVNNAGIGINRPFAETTEAEFDLLMNVHLKGVFFLTQEMLPLIADGGRIVNLSSGLTRFSLPGYAAYGAMKGGVEVLTRYLARDLGWRGIGVNTVAPGAVETDFGGGALRNNRQAKDFFAAVTALGRVGLPEDIGPAIANLLGDGNRWVNGQRIEISGGMFV